jgi:quercetin dioxygenase-like cupin family protein
MTLPTFDAFRQRAIEQGFDEVIERDWEPHAVFDEHQHPFDANALIVKGEMWLRCGAQERHLRPGDTFDLARGTPHAERYGPEGATYWVARRSS